MVLPQCNTMAHLVLIFVAFLANVFFLAAGMPLLASSDLMMQEHVPLKQPGTNGFLRSGSRSGSGRSSAHRKLVNGGRQLEGGPLIHNFTALIGVPGVGSSEEPDLLRELLDLPDIFRDGGTFLYGLTADDAWKNAGYSLIGKQKLKECLTQKHIVLLGDSTMGEVFMDIGMLLAGIGDNQHAMTTFASSLQTENSPHSFFVGPNGIDTELRPTLRNVTMRYRPREITVTHRFTGHYEIWDNFLGVETYLHPNFLQEFMCLIGAEISGCNVPDIIVFNSGQHDIFNKDMTTEKFGQLLTEILDAIVSETHGKVRIMWRSVLVMEKSPPQLKAYDDEAYRIIQTHYPDVVRYVNISLAHDIFKRHVSDKMYSHSSNDDFLHIGTTAKYKFFRMANMPYEQQVMTLSTLATQMLLNEICRGSASPVDQVFGKGDYNTKYEEVPVDFMASYIASMAAGLPDGQLIRFGRGQAEIFVYQKDGNTLRPIPNWDTFVRLGYDISNVHDLDEVFEKTFARGEPMSPHPAVPVVGANESEG